MNKLGLIALASAAVGLAHAQSIYIPNQKIADQGVSLKGWGSGTIAETDEVASEGSYSLRVTTRNYFQGGIINFGKPVDLSSAFGDGNNLIKFAIRSSGEKPKFATTAGGGAAGGGGPSAGGAGAGGAGGGAAGGGGNRGGGGGAGGFDGGGAQGGGAGAGGGTQAGQSLTSEVPLRNVRLVVTTTDGKKSEAYLSVRATGAEQWRNFSMPLQSINGFDKTNKIIQSIAISGDAISTFWVGEIRVINDTTAISGEMNFKDPLNLATGDEREFVAYGFAGSTPLKYTWDFDDRDGLQVDAEGQSIKHKFRKPGKYKVTVTISDLYGKKKAITKSVDVTVN